MENRKDAVDQSAHQFRASSEPIHQYMSYQHQQEGVPDEGSWREYIHRRERILEWMMEGNQKGGKWVEFKDLHPMSTTSPVWVYGGEEWSAMQPVRPEGEMVEEGKLMNKMMKYLIDESNASKIPNLSSANNGIETSSHDLCMPPGYDENTDVIIWCSHWQIEHFQQYRTLTNKTNKTKTLMQLKVLPNFTKWSATLIMSSNLFKNSTTTDASDDNNKTQNMIYNWIHVISATHDGDPWDVKTNLGLES
jgi:hypothetical protein